MSTLLGSATSGGGASSLPVSWSGTYPYLIVVASWTLSTTGRVVFTVNNETGNNYHSCRYEQEAVTPNLAGYTTLGNTQMALINTSIARSTTQEQCFIMEIFGNHQTSYGYQAHWRYNGARYNGSAWQGGQ
jgi:hypothetical protein